MLAVEETESQKGFYAVAFECRVSQVLEIAGHRHVVLGTPVAAHICDDAVLSAENCYIESDRLDLVARMRGGKGGGYTTQGPLIEMPRIDLETWKGLQR